MGARQIDIVFVWNERIAEDLTLSDYGLTPSTFASLENSDENLNVLIESDLKEVLQDVDVGKEAWEELDDEQ
ncbi:hypothetical protein KIN20_004039 [Parelaphostrongylus tenuis]|uniref:Uncharacterized protein n=1 Tax=Parelaphostrongylus tenuis TaxID=148309 RepID=A0AAD5QJ08_PARTN|nr:hypothetical protein KIN20_004039 [Parelaphostrongylus tenuis]